MTDMKKTPKTSRANEIHKNQPPTSESEIQHDHAPAAKNEEEQPASSSRRSFLGKVTAAAAAASILGVSKSIRSQTSMTDDVSAGGSTTSTSCTTGCDIELQSPA